MQTFHTPFSIIESLSKSQGDSTAIRYARPESTDTYKHVSYTEFRNDIENAAKCWTSKLAKVGVSKGAVIGLWLRGWSYEDLLHVWSLQRAGFIPQLFSLRMADPSIVYELLAKSKAAALIYDSSRAPYIQESPIPSFTPEGVLDAAPREDIQLGQISTSLDADQVTVIFHTSGSTSGMPKLVPITIKWLDSLIRKQGNTLARPGPQIVSCFMGSHAHLGNTINFMHSLANAGCLIMPTSIPYPILELKNMIVYGGLTDLMIFPALLASVFREARIDEKLLQQLQSLKQIVHAGQILEPSDDAWAQGQGIPHTDWYGSTELGTVMTTANSLYLAPLPESQCEFVPMAKNSPESPQLFELVIPPESADCPHPSLRSKEDGKFHTGDLFQEVDDKQYAYKGRVDDRIKMQLALICDTGSLEAEVMQVCEADLVSVVSVVGSGRPSPALMIEPKDDSILQSGDDKILEFKQEVLLRISPFHKRKYMHEKIEDARLIFVVPQGTLPRTSTKGNVMRKAVEELFKQEMDQVYAITSAA